MSKKGIGVKRGIAIAVLLPFILYVSQNFGRIIYFKEIRKLNNMTTQQVREYVRTAEQWRFYERYCLEEKVSHEIKSPERTHLDGSGDCGDKSLKAYHDLVDDGYANTFIDIHKPGLRHLLFYYEISVTGIGGTHTRYGILGDGDTSKYRSLEDIAKAKGGFKYRLLSFNPPPNYVNAKGDINVAENWTQTSEFITLK